jgi:myo-inositol catabolism protein IolC
MAIGYGRPLYVLPFDHRGTFQKNMFGWSGTLNDDQTAKTAAAVPGFVGFAVGRTSFWGPLTDWKDGRIARDAAVSEIARRYSEWFDIFESARSAGAAAVVRGGGA